MKLSMVLVCDTEFNCELIDELYSKLFFNCNKFELVLVSKKDSSVNNICEDLLSRKFNIKSCSIDSDSMYELAKVGVSNCIYQFLSIMQVSKLSENTFKLLNSLFCYYRDDRSVYVATDSSLLSGNKVSINCSLLDCKQFDIDTIANYIYHDGNDFIRFSEYGKDMHILGNSKSVWDRVSLIQLA